MEEENLYDEIMQLCIEQLTTANKKGGLYKARYTKNDPKDEKSYNITITEEQAKKHINALILPNIPNEYKTCNDIFRRLLISGQNSGRMMNLISFEKRETQFKNILGVDEQGNVDYKKVIEKYVLEQNEGLKIEDCNKMVRDEAAKILHKDFFQQIKGERGQIIVIEGDKSDWRKYARLVIDAALLIEENSRNKKNNKGGDYNTLKGNLDKLKKEGNYNLQKFIADNVYGIGLALACDFLKEIGYDMAKPDVHIKEFIKNRLGEEVKEEDKILEKFDKIANEEFNKIDRKNTNITEDHKIYVLDKLIWLCSSGKYYDITAPDGKIFEGIIVTPKSLRELFLDKI